MSKTLHIFDFDGTLTHKDSLLEFIKFSKGSTKLYLAFAIYSPLLVGMKLGLCSNSRTKERVFSYLYKGTDEELFNKWSKEFYEQHHSSLLRTSAEKYINGIELTNSEFVIVSASIKNWLVPFCAAYRMNLLSTEIEVVNGIITGRFSKPNCYGKEKVNRIVENYNLEAYSEIHVYGDSKGDSQMLELATHKYYKYFN